MEEARVLLVLSHQPMVKNKKELAEFLEISQQKLTIILAGFRKKEYVRVSKKPGADSVQIVFSPESKKMVEELQMAEVQFENARFSGLSEEEQQEYQRLSACIKENTLGIILK